MPHPGSQTALRWQAARRARGVQVQEIRAWPERGENWWRLKLRLPESAVAYTRASVMHFSDDGLLKRTDFDLVCGETLPLAAYSSAHQSFSGLTVPTLHRAVRRNAAGCASRKMSLLDIEIFYAAFD
jgi:hypothetical protein